MAKSYVRRHLKRDKTSERYGCKAERKKTTLKNSEG